MFEENKKKENNKKEIFIFLDRIFLLTAISRPLLNNFTFFTGDVLIAQFYSYFYDIYFIFLLYQVYLKLLNKDTFSVYIIL